ncbi:GNAT family N-acetyltransferase [Roseobacteraceae bacterium S113]
MTQNAGHTHVQTRLLCRDDRAAWGQMWKDYLAFYETTLPDEMFDITFERLLDPDHLSLNAHIAELDGSPVGIVHYIFHDHCWKQAQVCYLQDLFAKPEIRGAGIGRALIQSVYDAADARGAAGTYWLTQEFNTQARHLYDRVAELTPFIKYQRA